MNVPRPLAFLATVAAALALGVVGLVLTTAPPGRAASTGSGLDGGSPQSLSAVRAAGADALSDTARVRITFTGSTLFGSSPSFAVATGAFDFRVSEGEQSVAVSGAREGIPEIFYPTVALVRPAPNGASVPSSARPWIAATFSEAAVEATNRNFPDFISQLESSDPALLVSELAWGAAAATPERRGLVDGAGATSYEVSIDLRRALAQATGPARAPLSLALDSQISHLRDSGTATLAAHVWLDDSGRLVRMDASPPVPGVGTMAVTFSEFSQAVTINPPTAERVVSLRSLSPTGERENSNGGDSDGG
jgi:hypothetical protein